MRGTTTELLGAAMLARASTAPAVDARSSGFAQLLAAIEEEVKTKRTLYDAIEEILTLGHRFALSEGIASLTPRQTAMFEQARELAFETPTMRDDCDDRGAIWSLGIWSYGRIWLATKPPDDPACRLLGRVQITSSQAARVARRARELEVEASRLDMQISDFYAGMDEAAVSAAVYDVHESIDHTDPVLLYVGETTLTNFGKHNNLQERNNSDLPDCFFRRAARLAPAQWTEAERIFVFCFYWMRVAGLRGEEFNGRQLNPARLDVNLDEHLALYEAQLADFSSSIPSSIAEKARLLARLKATGAKAFLSYRRINGLTFYKQERLCPRDQLCLGIEGLSDGVKRHVANALGFKAGQFRCLDELLRVCVGEMAERRFRSDEPGLNAVEKLLKVVVDDAIEMTASDIGLSRGFRDLRLWQKVFRERRFDVACAWQTTDYYCGVFPSAALREELRDSREHLVKILYACAGRMQFNSWHYMPGHCPREAVPADRHFYLPPRMPDTAIWSDQHHAGHVLAQVRYTIRAPAQLVFDGHAYPGMVDLRLFRQSGAMYQDDDLFFAMRSADVIRALFQALSDYVARNDISVRIDAFDKCWFRDYYGGPAERTCRNNLLGSAAPMRFSE